MAEELGITVKKDEDFSEWYLEVVRKGEFVDQRTPLKGFDVLRPWGYRCWELLQQRIDELFKENGVENTYFPMLIPVSFFEKEAEHFEGFNPELVKVTKAGDKELEEELAIRTTSETIIYHMFSKWIRSYRDLPMKVNQWVNIVRWETKMTKPLVRPREFLWQEGHTAHATKEDALKQVEKIKEIYRKIHEEFLGLPVMILKRTDLDKFAGAEMSLAFDMVMPDGKIVQGATDHLLNQMFPKAFGVQFEDKDGKKKYVWTTSWGLSEREVGCVIMMHGDDEGAVLPPLIAPYQVVIIPIVFENEKEKVLKEARKLEKDIKRLGIRVHLDDRDEYTPGFKFNEWELKGVPLRVEIGPKDIEKNQIVAVKRNDGKKFGIKRNELKELVSILNSIQKELFEAAKKHLKGRINDAKTLEEASKLLKEKGGFVRVNWCGSQKCEEKINEELTAEVRGTLYGKQEKIFGPCIYCGKNAKEVAYVAKAY
ncbi:MAG: proline--tRNA ligase [Candidatus Aenigmatarchaeota archaeon]|nr:MAG: proline--tRNA ligase [Candidatus Aenigmarchaeota archaeon]